MAKIKKSSRWGSISGALLEVEVDISGVRQWGGADEVAVAAGCCVRKRETGERAEGQNPKSSRSGSISGAPSEMGMDFSGVR